MCYAIPGKVTKTRDQIAEIDYFGEKRNVRNDLGAQIKPGDFVYAQGGILVSKIDPQEARETLDIWRQQFFRLKKIDQQLAQVDAETKQNSEILSVLQKANTGQALTRPDILSLLQTKNPEAQQLIYKFANTVRQKEHDNACCVHGIIEFSNHCHNDCHYCNLRQSSTVPRYRLKPQQIVDIAKEAVQKHGFKALVLQSGEDLGYSRQQLVAIVKSLHKLNILIFLSIGERSRETYNVLYKAGARAALLRFETANATLYQKMRPGKKLEDRLDLIRYLKERGYLIATGFMIGLPGETDQDLINNLQLTKELAPEMYSFGPFIPAAGTPLAKSAKPDPERALLATALARLNDRQAKILVTTALETIKSSGKRDGLMAGGNSLMINVTPPAYRKKYTIYPGRPDRTTTIKRNIDDTVGLLKKLGRAPTDLSMRAARNEERVTSNEPRVARKYEIRNTEPFDHRKIKNIVASHNTPNAVTVRTIVQKALKKKGLDLPEVSLLLKVEDPETLETIFRAARQIKEEIYGQRLVLFAPLYVSSFCVNNCSYCAFHRDNPEKRRKLTLQEVAAQVKILEGMGHKRLLLEFGEDPQQNPIDFVTDVIKTIYTTRNGKGEIRRVNVNIAATDTTNYRKLKKAGIGTYQLFQETYHRPTYENLHQGPKADYERQLLAHDRAFAAGIDDIGLGVLFGLYDYKYEVLALLSHARYLEKKFGVGPHTISVPRWQAAATTTEPGHPVSEQELLKIIAILRLAVPYTGLIISTRENPQTRAQAFQIGVSQASAASRTEPGGYDTKQPLGQFSLHDHRSLDEVIKDSIEHGVIPSFCTACYRRDRTGAKFMEFAKPGDIKDLCHPNALVTFQEYLEDYASKAVRNKGSILINKQLQGITDPAMQKKTRTRLAQVRKGKRDMFF